MQGFGNIFTILAGKIDEATGKSREQMREQFWVAS
jgi:hypothetical protein